MTPPEQVKALGDSVAIPTAFLVWLKAISIPDAAAFAALVYTILRIAELIYGWVKRKRK